MPRSGAGVYVLPAGQPAITGTTISSTTFNLLTSDLSNALTTSVATDGQTPMVGNLSMGNNKITNLAVATSPGDAARFDQVNNPTTSFYYSVKSAGAVGNGIADDTLAINQANATATASGRTLFFPAGTYIVTQLTVLKTMRWLGEANKTTYIKLKSGTNPVEGSGALLWSPTLSAGDNAWIENITFDGNSAGNTQGDTIVLNGYHTRLKAVTVINSASNGITTNYDPATANICFGGYEGYYVDITIDSSQKTGWVFNGPGDVGMDAIFIVDSGLKTNNTYYSLYIANTANGRFNNLHPSNRDATTNVPAVGVYVGSGGNTFTNSHFEGAMVSLRVAGNSNTFESCSFYGCRSTLCVDIAAGSTGNIISGTSGLINASSNPHYIIMGIGGSGNKIDLSLNGNNSGIYFYGGGTTEGYNIINVTGYLGTYAGQFLYSGTPSTTDIINMLVLGSGGGSFQYPTAIPIATPTLYTSQITSDIGTFSNASVIAAYYYMVGKIVYFDIYYNIISIGTASGFLRLNLPFNCTTNGLGIASGANSGKPGTMTGQFNAGNISYMSFNNYDGSSACINAGNGHVAGWYVTN